MSDIPVDPSLLANAAGRTVLITGGANGIGAATAYLFNAHGAKVVISDLGSTKPTAETLIQTFSRPENAVFIPANILDWAQMTALFKEATRHFGTLDIVIANAGVMESHAVLDLDDVDEAGDLRESAEGFKVIDINLKGTLNSTTLSFPSLSYSPRLMSDMECTNTTSPPPRNAPYETTPNRLHRPARLHIRLLRRHRRNRLRRVEARHRRPPPGVPDDSAAARHPRERHRAVLDAHADHGWVRAAVAGHRAGGEYACAGGRGDCAGCVGCDAPWVLCYGCGEVRARDGGYAVEATACLAGRGRRCIHGARDAVLCGYWGVCAAEGCRGVAAEQFEL